MARPIKKGLDYFPFDTDIFENIQVRKLKSRYKSLGFLVYFITITFFGFLFFLTRFLLSFFSMFSNGG